MTKRESLLITLIDFNRREFMEKQKGIDAVGLAILQLKYSCIVSKMQNRLPKKETVWK